MHKRTVRYSVCHEDGFSSETYSCAQLLSAPSPAHFLSSKPACTLPVSRTVPLLFESEPSLSLLLPPQPLHTITPSTPLTAALSLLLEAGVSALPVVDERRTLLDIYARSEITALCKGNAYNRLQWEDVTVSAG